MESSNLLTIQNNLRAFMDRWNMYYGVFWQIFILGSFVLKKMMKNFIEGLLISF